MDREKQTKNLPTVGEIARRYGVPVHRVEYIVKSRGILPQARAGNLRVFADDQIERIAEILNVGANHRRHGDARGPE